MPYDLGDELWEVEAGELAAKLDEWIEKQSVDISVVCLALRVILIKAVASAARNEADAIAGGQAFADDFAPGVKNFYLNYVAKHPRAN